MLTIPKGTKDVLPNESYKWQYVEKVARETAKVFGAKEIRTPIFEHTEVFLRGVGTTTDIVNKEMYTFLDKGERSITLKPEGTAGVARSFIENSLHNEIMPLKMFYFTPVFRYEKPQAGRLREHHQFGVEVFGSGTADMDAEVITLAYTCFKKLGVKDLTLNINSIGCKECRPKYNDVLKDYFSKHFENLCQTCKDRFEKNPLRLLDCKEDRCREINKNAPKIIDYICDDCSDHFESLKSYLNVVGLDYEINPKIVRGLDYYNKTVFEFIAGNLGAKDTVCGGGRYDGLTSFLGGKENFSVGFGLGIERLLLLLDNLGIEIPKPKDFEACIIAVNEEKKLAFNLALFLREKGISVEMDHTGKSFKGQFKFANKTGCKYVFIIGEEEAKNNLAKVKNMETGEEKNVLIDSLLKINSIEEVGDL